MKPAHFPLALLFLSVIACREDGRRMTVPLSFVPLEPPTLSKVTRVDWTAATDDGEFSGSVTVGTAGGIRFGFPDDSPLNALTLRGYDSTGLLRAGANTSAAELSEGGSGRVLFHLYDEFQALTETSGPPVLWHLAYVDGLGRVVMLGGTEGTVPRKVVERIDLVTGLSASIGELAHARTHFGRLSLSDGRLLLAGGSDSASQRSVEIWNPSTASTELLPGAFRFPRIEPDVFEVDGDIWVADGNTSAAWLPAEVIAGNAVVGTSVTQFVTDSGRATFLNAEPVLSKIVRWGGFLGYVRTYSVGLVGEGSAEAMGADFYFPKVMRSASDAVIWTGRHAYCSDVAVIPPNGLLAGARFLSLSENLCASAVVRLGPNNLLVMGGANDITPGQTKVRNFDLSLGTFSDEFTPQGQVQRLVYPRVGAEAVRFADGTIVVVGGATRFVDGDLTADLTPLPRVEFRVPLPAATAPPR